MKTRRIAAVVGAVLLLAAAGAAALFYAARRREVTTSSAEAARVYHEAVFNERCFYFKEARLGYARALELDPNLAEAMLGLARLSGDETGTTFVRMAARLAGGLSERERLHVEMALALTEKRRDDALRIATKIRALYPEDVRAAMHLAGSELAKGNSEGAVKIFQDLLATDPNNPDAYNQIGYYYAFRGETDRAVEYLKKYQFMLPDSANPYDSLGEVLAYSGRYDEAISSLNRALQIKPDFFESWGHLGVAYEGKGEPARAIAAYEKAAELADSDSKRADLLMGAIRAAACAGDRAATERVVGRLGRLSKGGVLDLARSAAVAVLDLVSGRPAEAESRLRDLRPKLEAAYRKDGPPPGYKPDWPVWNLLMALAKLGQGQEDAALPLLEALVNPPNPWRDFPSRRMVFEGRARLAELLARRGDLERAEKLLEENRKWNLNWAPTREMELAVAQARREKALAASK